MVGTKFRQWATRTLREHITKGYTLNRKRIAEHCKEFTRALSDIQALLPATVPLDPAAVLELVKEFASTWVSLSAYDTDTLTPVGATKRHVRLTSDMLREAIATLRTDLLGSGEATDLFARERGAGTVEGIVGNVMQCIGGTDVYPTVEEKAAHLLHFMVKNHPYLDGNKRSGAFAFVWFLHRAKVKHAVRITPATLTALTLLVAESDPKNQKQDDRARDDAPRKIGAYSRTENRRHLLTPSAVVTARPPFPYSRLILPFRTHTHTRHPYSFAPPAPARFEAQEQRSPWVYTVSHEPPWTPCNRSKSD